MTTKQPYTKKKTENIGLDRADINKHDQIEIPDHAPHASHNHRPEDSEEEQRKNSSSLHRLHVSLSEKKHDAAMKVKNTLHIRKNTGIDAQVDVELKQDTSVLANPVTEKSGSKLHKKLPVPDEATAKDFFRNPVDTTKDKVGNQGNQEVAANIASREISHGQDADLLKAHDELLDAERREEGSERGKKVERKRETFEELLKERQNMFVRWTLDRHVTKVRVLPEDIPARKSKEQFRLPNGDVNWKKYFQYSADYTAHQYGDQYIGYGMDTPEPSKKTIMPNIERLIIASAPFQELMMTTRRVYRWENPSETAKYLAIYIMLWYLDMLLPGMLSALVYLTIHRRFFQRSMEDLRQDLERMEDHRKTALSLTEYIEKEGEQQWAEKILQEVGPWLMIQLSDLANFFEVTRNFYEWRDPSHSMVTLAIFVTVILVTAFTPTQLLIRVVTFGMGFSFFTLFPLAVNFPEYRLLASLPKRVFWNIPTHAEWSIRVVQAEGTRYKQTHPAPPIGSTSTMFKSPPIDYGHYTATFCQPISTSDKEIKTKGILTISSSSLRFTSHDKVIFTLPYKNIERIEKIDRILQQKIPLGKLTSDSGMDLKIVGTAVGGGAGIGVGIAEVRIGEKQYWLFENVEKRNEVFSQLIGFNEVVWQVAW